MKTIGILGGMSPQSTAEYYNHIIRTHLALMGDHAYPRIVVASVSFQQYIDWMDVGAWREIAVALSNECDRLQDAGADFALLATNTMHKVFRALRTSLPLLHIVDAVADEARARGVRTVGVTGTRFTMRDGFYADDLIARGLEPVLPTAEDQETIHRMIFTDLIAGVVAPQSRAAFAAVCDRLRQRGADAILLACTELALLVDHEDERFIDSTVTHAVAAWQTAIGQRSLHSS